MRNKLSFFLAFILIQSSCIKKSSIKIPVNTQAEQLSDNWQISKPTAEGMNQNKLAKATDYFFSESNLLNSKGLLIVRNNKLVYEAYCKDKGDRDQLQNIKSVTKSITSVITGLAVADNLLDSTLQEKVFTIIPENFDDQLDKREITIEHCLRMTTGLEDPFYAVNSVLPDNSITTSLGVDLVSQPGEKHLYNNGSANIIGGVIAKRANKSFENYTKTALLDPLGITSYHWIKHNDQKVNPAFDLYLYPRDLLKFGQFCLQNGQWNGEQLLPIDWLQKSTTYYEDGFDGKFGYHWWINEKYTGYYANGHGGQRVFIFPDKDLVIVHIAEPSTDDTNLSEIDVLLDLVMESVQ